MNWGWAISLDQFWRPPAFPIWVTLVAAGFFGVIVVFTLWRAEKSVANAVLAMITSISIGIAVATTIRAVAPARQGEATAISSSQPMNVALPALSCIDDLAGDIALAACEKVLFGSPESASAAVSYAASRIARLTAQGDAATDANFSPEMVALRRSVERDRYGLMAQALAARDHCTPLQCAAFRALSDTRQIVANMNERVYDGMIMRYAPSWNAPAVAAPASVPLAALPPLVPTGKPTNAEFPTATSIPPVSIMNPEPGTSPAPRLSTTASVPSSGSRPASVTALAAPAAKKPPAPKSAPVPGTSQPAAPTPAAVNQ
jgi:hypothetical protein